MKKSQTIILIISFGIVMWAASVESAVLGDVNRDGQVNLSEAVHALQVTSGMRPEVDNTYAPVQRTGQTGCFNSDNDLVDCDSLESDLQGQDGQTEKGVPWPNPRFTDNADGTVTDNLTGLMWLKDAAYLLDTLSVWIPPSNQTIEESRRGPMTWPDALEFIEKLNNGDFNTIGAGNCGYSDWHLPNIRELASLVDYGYNSPPVPDTSGTGQWSENMPFNRVQVNAYWSSTSGHRQTLNDKAWYVDFIDGDVKFALKDDLYNLYYIWPVRP